MASGKKYLSLEEAAGLLKLKSDELIRLREKGEIRGFADRGTWKFKADDVEEFRRRRQPDSDPDLPIMDDDGESPFSISPRGGAASSSDSAMDDDDDELGRQATVIRKGRGSTSDSDVRLVLDDGLRAGLTGSSDDLPVVNLADSDSNVRLAGDSSPRLRPDSDSDVKLVNPMAKAPDSDSDVKLVSPSGLGRSLTDSDSDVRLAPLSGSDSDVKLVDRGGSSGGKGMASDSDVALLPSLPDSGLGLGGMPLNLSSDDSGLGGSALFDAETDSSISLSQDSGIRLSGDSGIQLNQPADSGILLEGHDSGIQLAADSGIKLGGDSGIRLATSGESSKKISGRSSSKLKGGKTADDLEATMPMLLGTGDDDDLNATSPMLFNQSDDLNATDLEMPMLSEEEGGSGARPGAIVMFDDDDSDEAAATMVKKGGNKTVAEDDFDFADEASADDDELEVSDEVLGEDDELEDLDAFDSDDDDLDENFEAGASQIGFGRRQDKVVVPQEVEWGTGYFLGLLLSTCVLIVGAIISVDLLRITWAGNESAVYKGELIELVAGLFQ